MDATNYCNTNAIACYHWKTHGYSMETMHAHNEYEVYFSKCGGLNYYVDNRIYPVEKNDIFVFNSTDLHRINVDSGILYERYIITFLPEVVRELSGLGVDLLACFERRPSHVGPRLELSEVEAARFTELVDRLHGIFMDKGQYGAQLLLRLTLCEVLVFVNRLFSIKAGERPDRRGEVCVSPHRMNDIIKYIDRHFSEQIRLCDIAAYCHLEKSYLCRLFKRSTGMCITDYINYRRITLAAERLRAGASTAEVAGECGFNSETYFITMFKRTIGFTPRQYVQNLRRDPS